MDKQVMRFINGANGYNGITVQNDNVHVTTVYDADLKCCTEKSLPEQSNTRTMYYTTDTHKLYIGMGSGSPLADMSDVLVFDSIYDFPNVGVTNKLYIATKEKTAAVFNPATKQYFTITSADASVLTYHTTKDFPEKGDKNKLYLTDDNKLYRYDSVSNKYLLISEAAGTPLDTDMPSGDAIIKALAALKNDEAAIQQMQTELSNEKAAIQKAQTDADNNKIAIQNMQAEAAKDKATMQQMQTSITANANTIKEVKAEADGNRDAIKKLQTDLTGYRSKTDPITQQDLDKALSDKINSINVNKPATPASTISSNAFVNYTPYLVKECIPTLTKEEIALSPLNAEIAPGHHDGAGGTIMFGMPDPAHKCEANGMCAVTNHIIANSEGMMVYECWKRNLLPNGKPAKRTQFLFMPQLGVKVYINGVAYTENVDYTWYNLPTSNLYEGDSMIHRALRPALDSGNGDLWLAPTPNDPAVDPSKIHGGLGSNIITQLQCSHDASIYPDGLGGLFTVGAVIDWGIPALMALAYPQSDEAISFDPAATKTPKVGPDMLPPDPQPYTIPSEYWTDMLLGSKVEIEYYIGIMSSDPAVKDLTPTVPWVKIDDSVAY